MRKQATQTLQRLMADNGYPRDFMDEINKPGMIRDMIIALRKLYANDAHQITSTLALYFLANEDNEINIILDKNVLDICSEPITEKDWPLERDLPRVFPYGTIFFPEGYPIKYMCFFSHFWLFRKSIQEKIDAIPLPSHVSSELAIMGYEFDVDAGKITIPGELLNSKEVYPNTLTSVIDEYLVIMELADSKPIENIWAAIPSSSHERSRMQYNPDYYNGDEAEIAGRARDIFINLFYYVMERTPKKYVYHKKKRPRLTEIHKQGYIREPVRLELTSTISLAGREIAETTIYDNPKMGGRKSRHWVTSHWYNQAYGSGLKLRRRRLRRGHERGSIEGKRIRNYE